MLSKRSARVVGLAVVLLVLLCTPTLAAKKNKKNNKNNKKAKTPTVYFPESCKKTCRKDNTFAKPLPEAPTGEGNRPYQWSIVLLNQIKANLGTTSPPGVGRSLGVFTLCMYEAISLFESRNLKSWVSEIEKLPAARDEYMDMVIDGAAYTAIRNMFEDADSFDLVEEAFTTINGKNRMRFGTNRLAAQAQLASGLDLLNDNVALGIGILACEAVIEKFEEDGYDCLANPLPGTPEFEFNVVNDPQELSGITDCDAEMKSLNKWQPLCTPRKRISTGLVGDADCKVQSWLAPWAGGMTPFAIPEGTAFEGEALIDAVKETQDIVMGGPPLVDEGVAWKEQMMEVVDASASLGDVFKLIAEHWADGPDSTAPPGAWFLIANEAALAEKLDTTETAKLLMLVGLSLNDAGVGSWRVKSTFDSIRPLQMIQCGFLEDRKKVDSWAGPYQGVQKIRADEWQPYQLDTFKTPPFGGYVSGHSTFSSAASEALALFFKSDKYVGPPCTRFLEGQSSFERKITELEEGFIEGVTDVPNTGPKSVGYSPATDVVLCWDTFSAAARQAGESRIYGGIHVKADDVDGTGLGIEIARSVYKRASELFGDEVDVETAL